MKPEYLEPIKKDLLKRIRELESRAKSFHTRTQLMITKIQLRELMEAE
jgi:hypothetical protein